MLVSALYRIAAGAAVRAKGPENEYQQEWRLVALPRRDADLKPSGPPDKQHIEIRLRSGPDDYPDVKEIVLGPNVTNPGAAWEKIRIELQQLGYGADGKPKVPEIRSSRHPKVTHP